MSQRTVLITGASSGIGKAIARRLAKKGEFPILVSRDASKLDELKRELGVGAAFPCDVTKEEDVNQLVHQVIHFCGGLDVLMNNAGYGRFGGSMDIPMAHYAGMMETNYLGTVRMTQAFLPHLLKRKGRIINIASIAGLTGIPNLAAYCASKFAIMGYSEALALEFSPQIRVGVLCPGPVQTPFFQGEEPASLFPPLIAEQLLNTETVAKHAVRLIHRPRVHIIPYRMRWAMHVRHFSPRLYQWILKRIYDSLGQKKSLSIKQEERIP